jgi:GxxExxY protein
MINKENTEKQREHLNKLTSEIIGAAIRVHCHLGPGLLENAYQACLEHELHLRRLEVKSQVYLPIEYKGIKIKLGYKLDIIVNDLIVVELKACAGIDPLFKAQLLSYLRLSNKEIGLLINFHNMKLSEGIVRVVNGYPRNVVASNAPEDHSNSLFLRDLCVYCKKHRPTRSSQNN